MSLMKRMMTDTTEVLSMIVQVMWLTSGMMSAMETVISVIKVDLSETFAVDRRGGASDWWIDARRPKNAPRHMRCTSTLA